MSNTKLFNRGVLYTLNNIKPKEGNIVYTFKVGDSLREVTFKSVEQADEWLQKIIIY
tara:strand:+ start:2642 stop:2812 length:171 start_codon:yes stop_codon:yes gene_type:complete